MGWIRSPVASSCSRTSRRNASVRRRRRGRWIGVGVTRVRLGSAGTHCNRVKRRPREPGMAVAAFHLETARVTRVARAARARLPCRGALDGPCSRDDPKPAESLKASARGAHPWPGSRHDAIAHHRPGLRGCRIFRTTGRSAIPRRGRRDARQQDEGPAHGTFLHRHVAGIATSACSRPPAEAPPRRGRSPLP